MAVYYTCAARCLTRALSVCGSKHTQLHTGTSIFVYVCIVVLPVWAKKRWIGHYKLYIHPNVVYIKLYLKDAQKQLIAHMYRKVCTQNIYICAYTEDKTGFRCDCEPQRVTLFFSCFIFNVKKICGKAKKRRWVWPTIQGNYKFLWWP